tara:strand:+ start:483 stop:641 length:159 start_codon:yes stop_codon:yes gene_type:complete
MKLTHKQIEKIVQKLKDYNMIIVDCTSNMFNIQEISEEYLREKINEALEVEE